MSASHHLATKAPSDAGLTRLPMLMAQMSSFLTEPYHVRTPAPTNTKFHTVYDPELLFQGGRGLWGGGGKGGRAVGFLDPSERRDI
jgi:hypothetical protein